MTRRMATMAVFLLWAVTGYSQGAAELNTDCNFGFGSLCVAKSLPPTAGSSSYRVESFGGYKPGMSYYATEQKNCAAADCQFSQTGAVYGFDIYANVDGHNRSENYTDLGFQYLSIPVGSWQSDSAFTGTADKVISEGSGSLRYHFLRATIKRGHFLYLLRSKYLISSFGVGIAIPETEGTGRDIVAADRVLPSIGGKLGFQYPITPNLDIGMASGWRVLWYGGELIKSAFIAGYGMNISWRI